jgi:hypothetical protein
MLMAKKQWITIIEWLFVIMVVFAFFAYMLLLTIQYSERVRIKYDQQIALQMTEIIKEHEQQLYMDSYDIRAMIQTHWGDDYRFTPKSKNGGFFYLYSEHRIIYLQYEEAYTYVVDFNPIVTGFKSPDQLFGDGLFLLTLDQHPIADLVSYIYGKALPSTYLQDYSSGAMSIISFDTTLLNRMYEKDQLNEALHARLIELIEFYHPSKTLFVNNQSWRTTAQLGEHIQNIVFYPGISQIPRFPNRGYTTHSINLPLVVLPSTVEYVDGGAFGSQFSITHLYFTNELSEIPVEDAFNGVYRIYGIDDLYYRDNINFKITDLINGLPLVTYRIDYLDQTVIFDFSNMYQYYQSRSMVVMEYIVYFNERLPALSKIYVYTEEGYFGFIVPIRR